MRLPLRAPSVRRILSPPLRVKQRHAVRRTPVRLVVDVEVADEGLFAVVCDLDPTVLVERHRKEAVEAASAARAHGQRLRPVLRRQPMSHAEEVAGRNFDARLSGAVPPHAQHAPPRIARLRRRERHPEMAHAARPVHVGHDVTRSGRDRHIVGVAAAAVPRRRALASRIS